ncbi:MAG: endonuclease domain-containing protein [Bacteroidetes bacterium]|nr:endonuclease domain-containing protein [Bacteroidota bacterium]
MLRKIYQYRPDLKEKARHNRNHPTFAEKIIWFGLRGKQLGVDFDRQKPIGNFILDFYCKELNLGIELDGDSHEGQESYDEWRQSELEKLGIKLIRFENEEVIGNPDLVLKKIQAFVFELKREKNLTHPLSPSVGGGLNSQTKK